MGEYMHRTYFDGADKYCKDTFLLIKFFGSEFLPRLFSIKRKVIWSDFGPVIKNDKGHFAFFSQSLNNISAIEQWLRMSKSRNFQEFESALKLLGIPRFNIVYADKDDNILILAIKYFPPFESKEWDDLKKNLSKFLLKSKL